MWGQTGLPEAGAGGHSAADSQAYPLCCFRWSTFPFSQFDTVSVCVFIRLTWPLSPHLTSILSLVSVHVFVNEFPWLTVTSWRVWQNRASGERVGQCLDLDSMVSSVFFLLYVDLRYTKFKKITAAAFQCLTSGLLSLCREQNCFLS